MELSSSVTITDPGSVFVLGIDEAGYGPLLGPLVVSGTLWELTTAPPGGDFWTALSGSVCRAEERGQHRLPVGDSKEIFDRKDGLASLERSVLAFAAASGATWPTLRDLVASVDCKGLDLPWYGDLSRRLPVDPERSAFAGAAERLQREMHGNGLLCRALRAQVVAEGAYNDRVAQTRNKAGVVVEAVLRLIDWAGQRAGGRSLFVHVDRLGGRADYRGLLQQAFPDRALAILSVDAECSRYALTGRDSRWEIEFVVDADKRHMSVALASMFAKYLRELLMDEFNRYWRNLVPALRPTAGYYQDAQRFLVDIESAVAGSGVARERFVRAR